MLKFKDAVSFDDVLLVPQFSEIISRSEIDISTDLTNSVHLKLPVISAPMDTVTEDEMVKCMDGFGGLGIIHRYNSLEVQAEIVEDAIAAGVTNVGAAIGVSGDYIERARTLTKAGANVLCIDVAHGHHALMRHALKTIRRTLGWDIHIMAGNVATLEAFNDLADWGANSIRVGIGGGSICSTRIQTGHGMPTLQSILDCANSDRSAALVADGGMRNSGDVTKALAAGADAVILGSMLAGTAETPGEVLRSASGNATKVYRGMASEEAQKDWRGKASSVEGVATVLSYKGPAKNILQSLDRGVRSGFSYSGCSSMTEFQCRSRFIKQTVAGANESKTHINNIDIKD